MIGEPCWRERAVNRTCKAGRGAGVGVLLLLLFMPLRLWAAEPLAQPEPARVHLEYIREPGAEQCQDPRELMRAVDARLGRSVFAPPLQADIEARIRARRSGVRFTIDLQLLDRSGRLLGQRELRTLARHCSALDDSLALVLSLAADLAQPPPPSSPGPSTPAEPTPTTATSPLQTPPAPSPLATPITLPASAHAPRLGLRVLPSLGLSVSGGLLPQVGLGLSARLELLPPRFWPLLMSASFWRSQRLGKARGAEFSAQTIELAACPWGLVLGVIDAALCVEQIVGRASASGFGFDADRVQDGWLLAFGAGASGKYWLGHAFVSLSGSLSVPVIKRRYFFTDGVDVTLHEGSWLLGSSTLAVGLEL